MLIGLSSLTRYEPGGWTAAIDPDASELAVSLERLLNVAAESVPMRILEVL
ncbi:MAG: YaaC family protein [bacterium]